MDDEPDFLWEMSARSYAASNFVMFVGVAGLFVGLTFAVPGLRQEQRWVNAVEVIVPATLLFVGIGFGAVAVRGGTYRVVVCGGRLRVDSPCEWAFGPGFEVDLAEIERLVVRRNPDGPDGYEVRPAGGRACRVWSGCGDRLFEAIRRVRPDLAVEHTRHGPGGTERPAEPGAAADGGGI